MDTSYMYCLATIIGIGGIMASCLLLMAAAFCSDSRKRTNVLNSKGQVSGRRHGVCLKRLLGLIKVGPLL
jgi:hypothetical protein